MCKTYDKSKGGDTRELQSRMVPPPPPKRKKMGRVTLSSLISLERGKMTENAGSYKVKDLSVFVALVAMAS